LLRHLILTTKLEKSDIPVKSWGVSRKLYRRSAVNSSRTAIIRWASTLVSWYCPLIVFLLDIWAPLTFHIFSHIFNARILIWAINQFGHLTLIDKFQKWLKSIKTENWRLSSSLTQTPLIRAATDQFLLENAVREDAPTLMNYQARTETIHSLSLSNEALRRKENSCVASNSIAELAECDIMEDNHIERPWSATSDSSLDSDVLEHINLKATRLDSSLPRTGASSQWCSWLELISKWPNAPKPRFLEFISGR
jgi:hypothetical protein